MSKLLDMKNDYVFKRIFGHIGNEEITAGLLSSILDRNVSNLKLDNNPILEKDLLDDKVGILDIKAKIDNNINCDIEMQVVDQKNYKKSIKSGKDYIDLEKSIEILIIDFELDRTNKVEKYLTKWHIREENYPQIILTDVMEIYIIELPKFKQYKEKSRNKILNSWVEFIKNPEVNIMGEENKELKKAKKVLEEISQDEHERYLAKLRQKYIMDQKAIEDAGYDKGIKDEKILIAKKMKSQKMDIKLISEITSLSEEEIKNI